MKTLPALPVVDLGRLQIHGMRCRIVHAADADAFEVLVELDCQDVQSQRADTVRSRDRIPYAMPADMRLEVIRDVLVHTLEHELDEWLRIDGVQLHDPHAGEKAAMMQQAIDDVAAARAAVPFVPREKAPVPGESFRFPIRKPVRP